MIENRDRAMMARAVQLGTLPTLIHGLGVSLPGEIWFLVRGGMSVPEKPTPRPVP